MIFCKLIGFKRGARNILTVNFVPRALSESHKVEGKLQQKNPEAQQTTRKQ